MLKKFFVPVLVMLLTSAFCSKSEKYSVFHQVTGLGETNTYLLYDERSKEAALFDVGGPIDKLESIIKEKELDLKYIFITHCHWDHVYGVPDIKKKYPDAKICFSKEEYDETKKYAQWETMLDPALVAEIKKSPAIVKMANFDYSLIGEPEIVLKDDQVLKLGDLEIRTFLTPGHSRGSVCFYTENVLFSGDVLFYRKVGRTDLGDSGEPEEIVKSVRRLYSLLPGKTIVYPGHGKFTDIASEMKENEEVTSDKVSLQN